MRIRIYHTNDIHSQFDFVGRIHAYLHKHKTEHDFYFDSGDFSDQKSLIIHADKAVMALKLLNSCGLDAMTLGNNELDLGLEAVQAMITSGAPLLSTNVREAGVVEMPELLSPKSLEELKNAYPHGDHLPLISDLATSFILERAGKRFLILGLAPYFGKNLLTDTYNSFFLLGNLRTVEPIEALRHELERRKGQYDFVILLSHSGLHVDQKILAWVPQIDLCLGAHTHSIIANGKYSQSGMGEFLGLVTLEADDEGIRIVANEQIVPEDEVNPTFERMLDEVRRKAERILSKEMDVIDELTFDPFAECSLINFVCDALLKKIGGDLALMHHGMAEGSLVRPVSRKTLIELFPSKLNPTLFPVSGRALKEAVRSSLDPDWIRQNGKAAGFRGRVLGTLGFSSNVRVRLEPFAMTIDGAEVEDSRMYMLASDDYLQRGSGYPDLAAPDDQSTYHRWYIRDLVENYLMDPDLFESARMKRRIDG